MRAAVLGVVLALTLAGGAEAAVPVKLSLRSLDPAKIVKSGKLTVRVAAKRRGRVRVSAGRIAKAKTVRFKRRGRKTVRLKLTARGRRSARHVRRAPARHRQGRAQADAAAAAALHVLARERHPPAAPAAGAAGCA